MKPKQKTAIVTGGTKGIGNKLVQILAAQGFNLVICSRKITNSKKLKLSVEAAGVKCLIIQADVSKYDDCRKVVKKAMNTFSAIDLLINNAGIQGPVGKTWTNNIKEWEKTIQINLLGTLNMSHAVIPYMLKAKKGKIINLSGGGAAYARPLFSAYGCSKTAVLRLTETLAEELKGTKVSVLAVAPGAVWSNMTQKTLARCKGKLDHKSIQQLKNIKQTGGTSVDDLKNLMLFILSKHSAKFAGKLIHVNELKKIRNCKLTKPDQKGLLRRVDYK